MFCLQNTTGTKSNFSGPNIGQEQHLLSLMQELKLRANDNKNRDEFMGELFSWKGGLE